MYVHFIDTSIFTNIINVPGKNQQRDAVMKELKDLMRQKDKNFCNNYRDRKSYCALQRRQSEKKDSRKIHGMH